jgi:hypothetical protein
VLYYRGKSAGGPAFLALAAPGPFPFASTGLPAFTSNFFCLAASLLSSFLDNLTSPSAPTTPPAFCLSLAFLSSAF